MVAETAIVLGNTKELKSESMYIGSQESGTAKASMPTQGGILAPYLQQPINEIWRYGVTEPAEAHDTVQPETWSCQGDCGDTVAVCGHG